MIRPGLSLALALWALPVAAQDHSVHQHMEHAPPEAPPPTNAPADHAQMDHSAIEHGDTASDLPSDPPARSFEGPLHAADAIFGSEEMAAARAANRLTHGGAKTATFMADRLEAHVGDGHDTYLWDVEAWFGGDIDKFVLKSEGEGAFSGALEDAEVQALWGHAIGPFFDLQAGVRADLEPGTRGHAVIGVQGLAPYMIHLDAAAFLSDKGDVTARIEAEHDMRLSQRLVLQPRMEFELAAQDIEERGIGTGLSHVEAGLRLRYEITREFAPYVGAEYAAKLGDTAAFARASGEDPRQVMFLFGLRGWF